jgi:Zn ribbon nucleic-acid-binding protein
MAQTKTSISEKPVWIVEAECSGDKASWTFEDKDVAEWFRDTAQAHYMARCPSCGVKDVLNLQVSVDILEEVIVSCGYSDCNFAKRIVRTSTRDGQPIWIPSLPGKEDAIGS